MSERFGVVRGLSSEDAYSGYALLYFGSGATEGHVWKPDPLDERACIGAASYDDATREWTLRYSWRPRGRSEGGASSQAVTSLGNGARHTGGRGHSLGQEAGMTMTKGLNSAWWVLRVGLGLGPFLAGLDKYFNLLTDWGMYLNPAVEAMLPISGGAFMRVVGVVEMAVGLAILAGWTRIGGYVAAAWLLAIAGNLVSMGMFYDLAVRDVEIAIAAYTLARLSEARKQALAPAAAATVVGLDQLRKTA
jgi:uncharacterized membrane protein YphA (DoxX/SURF4 family)